MLDELAIAERLQRDVAAEPPPQDRGAVAVSQIVAVAHARVIAVPVRDHRPVDGLPRIDEEVAGRAVQAFRAGDDEVLIHRPRFGVRRTHARRC